jgi:hypothetical protein
MTIVRLEGLDQLKIVHLIGTRTRDLPACSIVPQPTTLPRAPIFKVTIINFKFVLPWIFSLIFTKTQMELEADTPLETDTRRS